MAAAARQRFGVMQGRKANDPSLRSPAWRPFQLAFLLMNLVGIARPNDPQHDPGRERDRVDLLFFPTGGGKTEAYLGLAAFTLVMRRLRHGGSLQAGTPNRMGGKGNSSETTARIRVLKYIDTKTTIKPIPIDTCPWCGVEFGKLSLDDTNETRNRGDVFMLLRGGRIDSENPDELRVACRNRSCVFNGTNGRNYLPLLVCRPGDLRAKSLQLLQD
jgi:hypothetical protein